ncbi:MAG: response regulator transcription factor [Planctomycetota bacterium]|jgi:DNA-binding response OmpR family regulator
MKQSLLIVEDEPAVARGLVDAFEFRGFRVDLAEDGEAALAKALEGRYDAIILDIMLPKLSGFDVMERMREEGDTTPTIMLTARGEEEDRVRGLMAGADDYVVKPFSITELVARVEANLRRRQMDLSPPGLLTFETVEVDLERHRVVREGRPEELPSRETDLLRYLMRHRDRVVSREELLENVWEYPNVKGVETRTVDNYVVRLRQKVEPDPQSPRVVLTVRGKGYRYGWEA